MVNLVAAWEQIEDTVKNKPRQLVHGTYKCPDCGADPVNGRDTEHVFVTKFFDTEAKVRPLRPDEFGIYRCQQPDIREPVVA